MLENMIFRQKFLDLKCGARLNNTENRAVTHFKYREPESDLYSKILDEIEVLTKLINHFEKNNNFWYWRFIPRTKTYA